MSATATSTHTDERLTVCDRAIRYLKGGSGSPIVTLHHSTGSIGWLPLHDELAKKHTVYVPDLPGYGQSERPEWARDPRDIAVLVNAALEGIGLSEVTLVGFGFGGFVAAELATMDASRVKRLVLVGAAGILPREGEIMDGMLMELDEYIQMGFKDKAAFHSIFGEEPDASVKELWDFSREMSARVSWKPYMFSRHLPPLLKTIKARTLLIWGSEDRVVPPVCGQQYREQIKDSRLEIIAGAGHYVELEDPARVSALITDFAK
jgi:pimeloyl-ACP methyl ester carboxylesterase